MISIQLMNTRNSQKNISMSIGISSRQTVLNFRKIIFRTCPPTPTLFQFDESLIEDKLGKLQANTLTVDNLTVEWLRTRLNELEASVKECQDRQAKYCNENGISAPSTPTMNGGVNGHNGTKDLNK